ncbi:MAG: Gfo/Idh/MocA family oxidoreductase [Bacteroidales bacterium]|nr:Gfo/Idh/MocA family oxidoreductase [Bacteroidales bacterium]
MKINLGIIGAGWIADKMAETITGLGNPDIVPYAISSRSLDKAVSFAGRWGFKKAFGSYEEMLADPVVNLVYIATPHSHHYAHARLAVEAGKAVLCEKAFTANAREAAALLSLAEQKGVFITEAIWTRYMPLSLKVKEILDSGRLGRPKMLSASLCYAMEQKERILRPDLCGGALLDLGVYCINFARMYFGSDFASTDSSYILGETGTDMYENITLKYRDGRVANLTAAALGRCNREGLIVCDDGYIVVENINCPEAVKVYRDYTLVEEYYPPKSQVTGYEYQVLACKDAMEKGWLESPFMPHAETVSVMEQMDSLRAQWGVRFPMD